MSEIPADERKADFRCLALLVLIASVFLIDVLIAGANFYFRDLVVYHFPMKRVVREAILSGEFPYWNRYFAGGQPIAANPAYELFYPPQLLILLGSFEFGFALHIVAHIYAALIGMYLLLRRLKIGPAPAFLGALSFGLGGLFLGSVSVLPTFFVWSLAPLVAWAVLRFLAEPQLRRFGIAVLIAGLQMLVGEPMAIAQVWLLICAGVLFAGAPKPRWRATSLAIAIAIGGVMVASVQLVPAADHARYTVRARGLDFDNVKDFSIPLARPAELVIPHAFGIADPGGTIWWGGSLFPRGGPYLQSVYVGIFIPIFALAGLFLRLPGARTTAALALLSYVLALGDQTPILRILYSAGVLRGFRYPEKFVWFGVVALIVFAATAADRLFRGEDPRAWRASVAGGVFVAVGASLPVAWSHLPGYVDSFARLFHLQGVPPIASQVAASIWALDLVVPIAAVLLLIAFRNRSRVTMLLGFVLLTGDLLFYGNQLIPRAPRAFLEPPAITADLQGDRRQFSIFHRGDWLDTDANFLRNREDSYFWTNRNSMRPNTAASWGFRSVLERDFDATALVPTLDLTGTMRSFKNSGHPRWAEPFMAISNVGYVLDYRDYETARREADGNPLIARPVAATPVRLQSRYYFATSQQLARSSREANQFFVANPEPYGVALVPFAPRPLAPADVLSVEETANSATLEVESSGPAFLVATVTRHKHWRATMDGRPATLLPANIAFQGLFVPPGRHRVELRYRDPLVVWGGFLSIAAVAGAMIMILRPRSRRLRSES